SLEVEVLYVKFRFKEPTRKCVGFVLRFVAAGAPPVLSISDYEKPRRPARHRSLFYIHFRAEEFCTQRTSGHVGRVSQQLDRGSSIQAGDQEPEGQIVGDSLEWSGAMAVQQRDV